MSKKSQFLKSATLAIASIAIMSSSALAKDVKMEKCYGVVKAGKNDCSSAKKGGHSCAGAAAANGEKTGGPNPRPRQHLRSSQAHLPPQSFALLPP